MNQRIIILLSAMMALINPLQTIVAAEIGSKMPNCRLTSINGAQGYDLQQFHGKVVYVDFWASWCTPCAESFPFLNSLHHDLKESGLQIIGINLDQASDDAMAFLNKYPADFTVVADANEKCVKDFEVKAMPSSYLVDRNGIIRHIHLGFRPGEAAEIRALTEQLLAEQPSKAK